MQGETSPIPARTTDRWSDLIEQAIFRDVAHFSAPPRELRDPKRLSPRYESRLRGFESARLQRQIACESDEERRVFGWLERSSEIRWYQEQPLAIPYTFEGQHGYYYPDAAVWDRAGRIVVVEVKPLFMMFRQDTLVKALGALEYLQRRGMGYLLIDSRQRTLAGMARLPHSVDVVETMESLFVHGPIGFRTVKNALRMWCGQFDLQSFVSIVVNRDWSVTNGPAVRIGRLPLGVSFRALCGGDEGHAVPAVATLR